MEIKHFNYKSLLIIFLFISLSSVLLIKSSFGGIDINSIINNNKIGGQGEPAIVYCQNHNGTIQQNGSHKICVFSDNSYCPEWEFMRQECHKGERKLVNSQVTSKEKYILFAHGMGADKEDWNLFADYAQKEGFKVFRTDVSKCGSINQRALELANYINSLKIPDNSLRIVAHSMGGIDARYLVYQGHLKKEPFYSAAKKINEIFTLATPNGGSLPLSLGELGLKTNGCAIKIGNICLFNFDVKIGRPFDKFVACGADTEAWHDLTVGKIEELNKDLSYKDFKIDGRKIGFLAFGFKENICAGASDCVVELPSQYWNSAPKYSKVFFATHSKDVSKNINNIWQSSCNAACNTQCHSCDCHKVKKGFFEITVCPPFRSQCLDVCNACRSKCKSDIADPNEQSRLDVLKIILNYPLYQGNDSIYNIQLNSFSNFKLQSNLQGTKLGTTKSINKNYKQNDFSKNNSLKQNINLNVNISSELADYLNKTMHNESINLSNFKVVKKRYLNETSKINNFTKNNFNRSLNMNKSLNSSFKLSKIKSINLSNKTGKLLGSYKKLNELNSSNKIDKNVKNVKKSVMNSSILKNLEPKNSKKEILKFNNHLFVFNIKNSSQIAVKPKEILNKLKNVSNINLENITLENRSNSLNYVIKVKEKAKILWLFPTEVNNVYYVDAQTGKIQSKTETPWYITDLTNLKKIFAS